MERDDNVGGFETVAVIISVFLRGTVLSYSTSVSTLIPPSPTTFYFLFFFILKAFYSFFKNTVTSIPKLQGS